MITSVQNLPAPSMSANPATGGTAAGAMPSDKKAGTFQSLIGDMLSADSGLTDEEEELEAPLLNIDPANVVAENGMPLPLQQLVMPPAIAAAMIGGVTAEAAGERADPRLKLALIESEQAASLVKGQDGGILSLLQRTLNKSLVAPPSLSPVQTSDLPLPATVLTLHSTVMINEPAMNATAADMLQMQLQSVATPNFLASGVTELSLQQTGVSLASPLLAAQTTVASTPGTPPPIATPIHQPQWNADLGNRILWMVKQDVQTADIKLNPPHLGPLEVRVSMANDNVSVTFSSHHGLVRDALDAAMPRLRDMLMDNGLQLINANVSNKAFSEHQNPGQGHQQSPGFGNAQSAELGADSHEANLMNAPLVGLGLVDYYA